MKKFILLIFSLFLVGCSSSMVVKPLYINPEADLRDDILESLETYKKTPKKELVPHILASSSTYVKRIDMKLQHNNKMALK